MPTDYTSVTETPGVGASREQVARLYQRYRFALQFCKDKDVLEVACGAGQGLGYLASAARKVAGGDIDEGCLEFARQHYAGRSGIELRQLDAHKLPYPDDSFDVVLLYEAIYYLQDPKAFLDECRRVLRNEGKLIICSVNRSWPDFNPSPHSVKYFSAPELTELLGQKFIGVQLYGGFQVKGGSPRDRITSMLKRTAVAMHLVPKTMKGKEKLKRIFFGKLVPLPAEVREGLAEYSEPVQLPCGSSSPDYKVLFAVATR